MVCNPVAYADRGPTNQRGVGCSIEWRAVIRPVPVSRLEISCKTLDKPGEYRL